MDLFGLDSDIMYTRLCGLGEERSLVYSRDADEQEAERNWAKELEDEVEQPRHIGLRVLQVYC